MICMVIACSKGKDQPGKVTNPARGQLNREMNYSLSPFAPEKLVSRDGVDSPVPRQPAPLHTILRPNMVSSMIAFICGFHVRPAGFHVQRARVLLCHDLEQVDTR